ncbi:CBO0543 family protein [Bacillus methanolicus]|uniref:Uncharacterized protein n=1 Tax=Bacillus methanolicus (strain MGA3 / ATCC 53907) TaxID=796606 RepID=I3DTF1_BACMM|nr:CBO0543 family protein [Bacillus methanolicus]AIE61751.1 hypothetical protein BMMGA3_17020 [Bacillus methanolicus MGA3]EIJ77522.1 hypothetical protein MGA3_17522 [Bacillus methanolicus MGA3]
MNIEQKVKIEHLKQIQFEQTNAWLDYWKQYSSFEHWQFWVNLGILVIPLIVLYIFLDKRKALLLGFYGFNVHVWINYIDAFGVSNGLWFYPYKIFPFFQTGMVIDVSLIPVAYMLVYQWTLNHKRNYYLYIFGLCLVFAFVIKPAIAALGLLQLGKGTNYYFHILSAYVITALISKLITNIFIYFEEKSKAS